MGNRQPRVLLVEDDVALRDAVTSALSGDGYTVRAEPDGTRIRQVAADFRPDLAALDVRLPQGPSGLSIARLLRDGDGGHGHDSHGSHDQLPIIFLTAADSTADRLAGFAAGADDYLVKPFAMAELLARVRALLRRAGKLTSEVWNVGDLVIDEADRTVRRDGTTIELTRTEFDLLVELGRRPGRVLSKTQLLGSVWGFASYDPNLVEVHISALRRKLERHGPRLIHTVRGSGYRLRAPGR
jgi:two-component system, OmpR family, response regulator